MPQAPQRPPYPGARDYPVIDALLDEGDALRIVLLAIHDELPAPKVKMVPAAKAAKAPTRNTPAEKKKH